MEAVREVEQCMQPNVPTGPNRGKFSLAHLPFDGTRLQFMSAKLEPVVCNTHFPITQQRRLVMRSSSVVCAAALVCFSYLFVLARSTPCYNLVIAFACMSIVCLKVKILRIQQASTFRPYSFYF